MIRFSTVCLLLAFVATLGPDDARADFDPAGDVSGSAVISDRGFGGGVGADLYVPWESIRIGAYLGVVGVIGGEEEDSQVLVPVAGAVSWLVRAEHFWLDTRLRLGVWTGAFGDGFGGGFWASPAFYVGFPLGPQVAVGVGVEGWFAFGGRELLGVAPGLTLAWVPFRE